ncbi:MAG: OmpA family protein [Cyclobacteriaceae bacterium]
MRNIKLLAVVLLAVTSISMGQEQKQSKGDYYFEHYSFKKAIKNYQIELKAQGDASEGEIERKIASSYRLMHDYENAEIWYEKLMALPARKSIDIYYYAEMLKSNGKYNDYLLWMRRYQKSAKNDSRVSRALENKNYIKVLLEDKGLFELSESLPFNTKYSEIAPAYYFDEEIVYSSNTYKFKLFGKKDEWSGGNFYDFYAVPIDSLGNYGSSVKYDAFNTKYHDVGMSFSKEADEAYFSRTYYYNRELEKGADGDHNISIFSAKKEDGYWGDDEKLSITDKNFSTEHPSLSADGQLLFFASDMEGGFGGYDIYYAERQPNGSWGKPVNMGPQVNTEGEEVFPFFHESTTLYFSSDGLPGLGGLDVFEAKLDNALKVKELKNLGYPINEMKDDFGLIMNKEQTKGYYVSNRPGGKGDDDIYSFIYYKPKYSTYKIQGVVSYVDSSALLLDSASVVLKDKYGVVIDTVETDAKGQFVTGAEVYGDYFFLVEREGYKDRTERLVINRGNEQKVYNMKIGLEKAPPKFDSAGYILNKMTDYEWEINQKIDTLESLAEAKLNGMTLDGRDKKFIYAEERDVAVYLDSLSTLMHTNTKGNYVEDLDDEYFTEYRGDIMGEVETLNKIFFAKKIINDKNQTTKNGSTTNGTNNVTNTTNNKDGRLDNSFKSRDLLESIDGVRVVDNTTIIPPIYFNYNDDNINKFSEKSLAKIIKFMKKNEDLMLEVRSHTDCRGDSTYNIRLSERRAQHAALYIIKRGIFLGRIRAYGLGENDLFNECGCDTNKDVTQACTEEHHRENRRSEFTFLRRPTTITRSSVLNE